MTRTLCQRACVAGSIALLIAPMWALPASALPPCEVRAGYDLFVTDPTQTYFDPDGSGPLPLMHFGGVPVGEYAFPGVGTFSLGQTDTVVHRANDALPGGPLVIIQLERIQLQSVEMPGLYATLQSDRGRNPLDPPNGPLSTGSLALSFAPDCMSGHFDSTLDVHFDIRLGSVDGPIISGPVTGALGIPTVNQFTSTATDWVHGSGTVRALRETAVYAQHGVIDPSILINGVNHDLNGIDELSDFRPGS